MNLETGIMNRNVEVHLTKMSSLRLVQTLLDTGTQKIVARICLSFSLSALLFCVGSVLKQALPFDGRD